VRGAQRAHNGKADERNWATRAERCGIVVFKYGVSAGFVVFLVGGLAAGVRGHTNMERDIQVVVGLAMGVFALSTWALGATFDVRCWRATRDLLQRQSSLRRGLSEAVAQCVFAAFSFGLGVGLLWYGFELLA